MSTKDWLATCQPRRRCFYSAATFAQCRIHVGTSHHLCNRLLAMRRQSVSNQLACSAFSLIRKSSASNEEVHLCEKVWHLAGDSATGHLQVLVPQWGFRLDGPPTEVCEPSDIYKYCCHNWQEAQVNWFIPCNDESQTVFPVLFFFECMCNSDRLLPLCLSLPSPLEWQPVIFWPLDKPSPTIPQTHRSTLNKSFPWK